MSKITREEVCKALSEWLEETVYYEDKMFVSQNGKEKSGEDKMITQCFGYGSVYLHMNELPPHLITLIGRFYEGVDSNE